MIPDQKRHSIRRVLFGFLWVCAALGVSDLHAQQRPLQTQDPGIIAPGNLSLEFGFDFLQNAKYPQSGLQGDLTSLGVIGINLGLGEIVEFQIQGTNDQNRFRE